MRWPGPHWSQPVSARPARAAGRRARSSAPPLLRPRRQPAGRAAGCPAADRAEDCFPPRFRRHILLGPASSRHRPTARLASAGPCCVACLPSPAPLVPPSLLESPETTHTLSVRLPSQGLRNGVPYDRRELRAMATFRIAVLGGDGIGPEVIDQAVRVADAALRYEPGTRLEWNRLPWN